MSIAPLMIACKERYAKLATISVPSFLKHHRATLIVIVDLEAFRILEKFKCDHLKLVAIDDYLRWTKRDVGVDRFDNFKYDGLGDHDRAYSSLKPLIMEKAVRDYAKDSKYVLSLDVDTLFTGNIMSKVKNEIRDKKELYMVKRDDPRMLTTGANQPGSGFTLWRRDGRFIQQFTKRYSNQMAKFKGGGSQNLIHSLMLSLDSRLIDDPMLHFVSPDLKNPNFPDSEIKKLKPAYIHLHGKDSFNRLKRFKKIIG